jgi:DNA-binding transcriptional ArsR family regulator
MKYESVLHPTKATSLSLAVAASTFAALGSEQRLGVLRVLVQAGPRGLSIGELAERSDVSGSTLTHHMKILAAAGLIQQQKQGRSIISVGAVYDDIEALCAFLMANCCACGPACQCGPDCKCTDGKCCSDISGQALSNQPTATS